jgi:hypothetical protein
MATFVTASIRCGLIGVCLLHSHVEMGVFCCRLQLCVKLCETYKQQYMLERDALKAEMPERVS